MFYLVAKRISNSIWIVSMILFCFASHQAGNNGSSTILTISENAVDPNKMNQSESKRTWLFSTLFLHSCVNSIFCNGVTPLTSGMVKQVASWPSCRTDLLTAGKDVKVKQSSEATKIKFCMKTISRLIQISHETFRNSQDIYEELLSPLL